MNRSTYLATTLIVLWIVIQHSLNAQTQNSRNEGCKQCHECDVPTKLNPCLKKCPREQMVTPHHLTETGPDAVTMNKVPGTPDVYKPVQFSHRAHAKKPEMSGGCALCHHYNPAGPVLACRVCHAADTPTKNSDLSKPGLQGAYHRQCVNCHRESGLDTSCDGECHRANSASPTDPKGVHQHKTDVHVAKPDRYVFESGNPSAKVVTFFHSDHADRFGLACSTCHAKDKCSKCHQGEAAPPHAITHLEGGHDRCSSCHSVKENCSMCHDSKPLERFDHARKSRFDLGKFHSTFECSRCHKESGKFTGLSRTCTACHSGWKNGAFDHTITGLKMSESHASLDCESCHLESNFAKKPVCSTCHDDRSYPSALPGVRVQRLKTANR